MKIYHELSKAKVSKIGLAIESDSCDMALTRLFEPESLDWKKRVITTKPHHKN